MCGNHGNSRPPLTPGHEEIVAVWAVQTCLRWGRVKVVSVQREEGEKWRWVEPTKSERECYTPVQYSHTLLTPQRERQVACLLHTPLHQDKLFPSLHLSRGSPLPSDNNMSCTHDISLSNTSILHHPLPVREGERNKEMECELESLMTQDTAITV